MWQILQKPEIKSSIDKVKKLIMIDPVGYLDMIQLEKNADKIITDSFGMQKEAYFVKRPCITIRDESEWVETVHAGYNVIVGADSVKIASAIKTFNPVFKDDMLYGDGKSAESIIDMIKEYLN